MLLKIISNNRNLSDIDTRRLEAMIITSQRLAVESLLRQEQGIVTRGPGLMARIRSTMSIQQESPNVHGNCKNARLYRENRCRFHQVAVQIADGQHPEWSCQLCGVSFARAELTLSSGSQDRIWIGPSGFQKAHCTSDSGQGWGWTCIWARRTRDCYKRFLSERDLLKHMRTCHVHGLNGGQEIKIDWPSGSSKWSADKCGYGAVIGGNQMQDSGTTYIVS